MASTIKVNTIDSYSGTNITIPSGKTLTVGGKSVTAGSSNIQRATGDVTVATTAGYDVSGKSELVIAANASAATRTITLCPVTETGVDTCIITIVADADATSTYKLTVLETDGSTEVWTGYQKGDFVRLIVSNSAWLVLDHHETMFSSRYLTSDTSIAASATSKVTGWTSVTDIGGGWDDTNNKLVAPYSGFWYLTYLISGGVSSTDHLASSSPVLYVGGSVKYSYNQSTSSGTGYNGGGKMGLSHRLEVAASTDIEFYAHNLHNTTYGSTLLGGATRSQFAASFHRTY